MFRGGEVKKKQGRKRSLNLNPGMRIRFFFLGSEYGSA